MPGARRPVRARCSTSNEIVLQRLRGVCPLTRRRCSTSASPARCCARPATRGTCARRRRTRSYERLRLQDPGRHRQGDNYDRYAVRLAEIDESVRIIEQALDGLPEGPHITDDRKVALPPRHELATSMEALIHHFKLVTEGFRVPPGEAYYPIESPRGELGCFVRSDGSLQAGARAHARPVVREPAGARADGQGRLHRRPDRDARDARPDPGRDRPLMASIDRSRASRTARASPAGTTPPTSTKDPAVVPDPATTSSARRPARRDRGAHGQVPDRRSAAIPALHGRAARARLVLAGGDRAGRVRHAAHARRT